MTLSVLALIPARAGSRGLRHKNIRRIGGEPLLTRAIHLALACPRRGERWSVVVSTDSERYARLAQRAGAEVPFLRPARLATSRARLADVVLHALAMLEARGRRFDVVVLLSAATPLTVPADVRAALRSWRRRGRRAVLSVVRERAAPSWRFTLRRGRLWAPLGRRVGRRQEADPTYVLNGALYIATPAWLRRHRQFFAAGASLPFLMPASRSLDIEDAGDLRLARVLLGFRR